MSLHKRRRCPLLRDVAEQPATSEAASEVLAKACSVVPVLTGVTTMLLLRSSAAIPFRQAVSPATGVSVHVLRKLRAHTTKRVRRFALMHSDSEAKAPCMKLAA